MSKFGNWLLLAVWLSCFQATKANGLLESHRLSQKVVYANGAVEVSCAEKCVLVVDLGGEKYSFDEQEIGVRLVPDHLRLFYEGKTQATIETEIACDNYPDAPPAYYCLSDISIDDGKIELIQKFRRTESDSDYSTSAIQTSDQ